MIQVISKWMDKPEAVHVIRLDVDGDTDKIVRIIGHLIRYWGGWFALDGLPNGQYDLHVRACEAQLVQKHIWKVE